MSDPRWSDATEVIVARVLAVGGYDEADQDDRDTYHIGACTILAALADAGLLVPPSGNVREERGYVTAQGPRLAAWSSAPATIRRSVTEWSDGSVLIGPWSPLDEVTS
jgi:hypothetical protein